jgi:hypothetical protein
MAWHFAAVSLHAQTNSSSTVDGGGIHSSNATFENTSAIGQGCPVGFNASFVNLNYSGFLNTFLLAPEMDADADGIADENDPDDDNDQLADTSELAGTGFNPSTSTDPLSADSDGDGAGDGAEAVAGTNPQDADSQLLILFASTDGINHVVQWQSRAGKQYEVLFSPDVAGVLASPVVLDTVTASGGSPPWFETTSTSTNPATGEAYYAVRVQP